MAHCKPSDLIDLKEVLQLIRDSGALKEKSPGCFYLKGKGVLHFHRNKDGRRFAHVWTGKKWLEIDSGSNLSPAKQRALYREIVDRLPAVK